MIKYNSFRLNVVIYTMENFKLVKGAKFRSFEVIFGLFNNWEEPHYVKLCKHHSLTMKAAAKRATKKSCNKDLKYAEMNCPCVHGRRKGQATSSGIWTQQRLAFSWHMMW